MAEITVHTLSKKVKLLEDQNVRILDEIELLKKRLEEFAPRPRGPNSTRKMTEEDAKRVVLGDLKSLTNKDAAAELGLSYGQIYSARGGYTFTHIYEESLKK